MHKSMCTNCLLLFLRLSSCLRCATFRGMVVNTNKQCRYGTYIVSALKNNNIAVFTQIYVIYNHRMAAYTIVMAVVLYAVKTWVQKNECLI